MVNQILRERYKIQRQLKEKTGQKTLLALDQQTHDLVIIKLLLFNGGLKWEHFKLFEREAKILKELNHPAIPHYLDYFDVETNSGKGFALVQSYINASSLEEQVKAGRTFSETELKEIAKEILAVLLYLHNRYPSIIHRDIKPGNILLTNRSGNSVGQVYLVDFGSVQAAVSEGATRTIVGTYGYMPPEQFGERAVPASDLYALGTTLIYLASGQHPADLPQKTLKICFENYVSLSNSFIDWLRWITEPSLEERLASADHALQILEQETPQNQPLALLVPVKPENSKVVLIKNHNVLKIYIPPKGFTLKLLPIIGFALIWDWFLAIAVSSLNSGGFFAPLFSLLGLGVSVWLILQILFAFFGQVGLKLDQEKISLWYQLFGCKYYRPLSASRHHILKLERPETTYRTDHRGCQIEVKPQINIWAGTKKFTIGGGGLLSESELDWLANELSNWLGLPVIQGK
ncbi:MAG: protein kinase [Symploca sp. SIO1A3]|nr:protein kinase [Symploca sp. SIO2C1]NER50696.1 protein kinase [Symploca sp. SIO1A3]